MRTCSVCNNQLGQEIYRSAKPISLTSLCEIVPLTTKVYFCDRCTHVQKDAIDNIESFYSNEYKILIDTEEEDQLYKLEQGKKIFRFDHQVETLLRKINIPTGAKLLDYGCAKASTIKKLIIKRPDIKPHLFDVSDMYKPFWAKFTNEENVSTFKIKPEWINSFDVVTSFFALEHIPDPKKVIKEVHSLLKEGGTFYCIVPNVYTNTADFVVLDHVNHFSKSSIETMLYNEGFSELNVDEDSHSSAIIFSTKKTSLTSTIPSQTTAGDVAKYKNKIQEISQYWINLSSKIETIYAQIQENKFCIYGSGFYSSFIVSCLPSGKLVDSFLDQNPYRVGKQLFGKDIISPENIPDEIQHVVVGLNPRIAREEIEKIHQWKDKSLKFFYI